LTTQQNFDLFKADGCDNCEEFLDMKGSNDRVLDCTTTNFTGFVACSSPSESWVAKWLRMDKGAKGVYAMRVNGSLPEDLVDVLHDRGIKYPPEE
jgi:transcription elongation factor SPT4